jgi:DnaJ-class molecular chaperone
VKAVYRKLALQYHPDRNKNPAAWERFKEIAQAYVEACAALQNQELKTRAETLDRGFLSPSVREELDPDSHDGRNLFDVSRPLPFPFRFDSKYVLEITLDEVATGARKTFLMIKRRVCVFCEGWNSSCGYCNGTGITEETHERSLTIPAGVEQGMQFKLARSEHLAGDIFVQIIVKPHRIFQRIMDSLYCEVPISATQLRDGTEMEIRTLDGSTATLHVPPRTSKGTIFVLREKGLPKYGTSRKGSLIVKIV